MSARTEAGLVCFISYYILLAYYMNIACSYTFNVPFFYFFVLFCCHCLSIVTNSAVDSGGRGSKIFQGRVTGTLRLSIQ